GVGDLRQGLRFDAADLLAAIAKFPRPPFLRAFARRQIAVRWILRAEGIIDADTDMPGPDMFSEIIDMTDERRGLQRVAEKEADAVDADDTIGLGTSEDALVIDVAAMIDQGLDIG